MEQRHRHQGGGSIAAIDYHTDAFRRTDRTECPLELQGDQRLADCAMGRQHALGQAGGARGVEDHRRITGTDRLYRHAQRRGCQQVLQPMAMLLQRHACAQPRHHGRQPLLAQVIGEQLQAWLVAQQQGCAAVLQTVEQFVTQPPAVERYTHRTATLDGGKRHQPGGLIAHGNGHAITLAQAKGLDQLPRQAIHLIEKLAECQALLLPHQKFTVTVDAPAINRGPDAGGGMTKKFRPAIGGCLYFKRRAGTNQLLPGALPLFKFHLVILLTRTARYRLKRAPAPGLHSARSDNRHRQGLPGPPGYA